MAERGGEARWDVFLAYASPDRARAAALHDALAPMGSAGYLDRAVTLLEDNLAACERALGAEHVQTLACRNNLAGAYGFGGQADRAVPLLEDNVSCYERSLGPCHLQTLVCRNILASAHHDTGDDSLALPLLEANVVDCEQALGPDHPQTRIAHGNLDQGRPAGS